MSERLFDDPRNDVPRSDDPRSEDAGRHGYVLVALERGIDRAEGGLTYAVPAGLADLRVGDRVSVPLGRGNKPADGIVVGRRDAPPAELAGAVHKIKPVLRRAAAAGLPDDLVTLARWIAGYYACPLGMVFASLLPAAVKRGVGTRQQTLARLAGLDVEPEKKPTARQQAVLDVLAADDAEPWMELKELADRAGAKTVSPVKQLIAAGRLETRVAAAVVSDLDLRAQRSVAAGPPPELTAAQADAVAKLTAALGDGFCVHLLHGVTGSGKTEVYLRVIEALLSREYPSDLPLPGAIVLVPEIALTPQTVGRFLARFPAERVAVLHSGLTAAQRHAQWQRLRSGEARVAVGARSAVFAPLPRLGLIVVDEEHESSYKQDQLPRYHARDVAVRRGQLAGCPVVLGSATPSLESAWNAGYGTSDRGFRISDQGKDTPAKSIKNQKSKIRNSPYHLLRLPSRVPGAELPHVELVDLAEERRQRRGIHLLSQRLEAALRANLEAGGQAILLLNRRGYANYLACPDHRCGWMMRCDHCDVTMVLHRGQSVGGGDYTRCHHCGAEQMLASVCPDCGRRITTFGLGTQRVEEELARKFPGVRLARMDADAMRTAADYRDTLDRFAAGGTDVLLGTQMIAKGLDVPNVRLVGVVLGDTSLHFPDFRAGERTFQLIAQVAGRAGRGAHRGRVIVQTFRPDDPAVRLAAEHDYDTFAKRELAVRADAGLPPAGRMARVVLRDPDDFVVRKRAAELAAALREANGRLGLGVRVRGPAVCPIARLADHHRHQIELISPPPGGAAALQKLLTDLRNAGRLVSDAHAAVDVDPLNLL
ncbi:MAG: primosomal protein N' [Planctomycetota bacterium]